MSMSFDGHSRYVTPIQKKMGLLSYNTQPNVYFLVFNKIIYEINYSPFISLTFYDCVKWTPKDILKCKSKGQMRVKLRVLCYSIHSERI